MFPELNEAYYYCPICGFGPFRISIMSCDYAYSICECCGAEDGLDDTPEYKKEWLEKGAPWSDESAKPKKWNFEEQLKYSIDGWSCWLSENEKINKVIEKKKALGLINDSRTVDSLAQDLKNENREIRLVSVQLLERIRDARAIDPLITALKDEYPIIRWIAADALEHMINRNAVEPLIHAMNDDDPFIRTNAIVAIGKIEDRRLGRILITGFKG